MHDACGCFTFCLAFMQCLLTRITNARARRRSRSGGRRRARVARRVVATSLRHAFVWPCLAHVDFRVAHDFCSFVPLSISAFFARMRTRPSPYPQPPFLAHPCVTIPALFFHCVLVLLSVATAAFQLPSSTFALALSPPSHLPPSPRLLTEFLSTLSYLLFCFGRGFLPMRCLLAHVRPLACTHTRNRPHSAKWMGGTLVYEQAGGEVDKVRILSSYTPLVILNNHVAPSSFSLC